MLRTIFLAAFTRGFIAEQPHAKPKRRRRAARRPLPAVVAAAEPEAPLAPPPTPAPRLPPGHVDTGTFSRLADDDAKRREWLAAACKREAEIERERCRVKKGGAA